MINLGTEQAPAWVNLAVSGAFVDAIVRAPDEAALLAAALAAGLRYEITAEIVDEETGETSARGTGDFAWAAGVSVDVIGAVTLSAGTYDDDGEEITAPVVDQRYHVNIRLAPPAVERLDEDGTPKWHRWALAWSQYGEADTQINAAESALVFMGVALIDPDTIRVPVRTWL